MEREERERERESERREEEGRTRWEAVQAIGHSGEARRCQRCSASDGWEASDCGLLRDGLREGRQDRYSALGWRAAGPQRMTLMSEHVEGDDG